MRGGGGTGLDGCGGGLDGVGIGCRKGDRERGERGISDGGDG